MRYRATLYLALWNIFCLSLVGLGWSFGVIQDVFTGDKSHLTLVSAALMAVAVVYTSIQTYRVEGMPIDDEHHVLANTLEETLALPIFLKTKIFLYLGLAGTVIGLSLFAAHMSVSADQASADGIQKVMESMKSSLETAFNATLVGIVCKLWTEVIVFIQGWPVRKLHVQSLGRPAFTITNEIAVRGAAE